MDAVLLVDFGSTRTKVTAVDPARAVLLGTASAPTTVQTDVALGLEQAMQQLFLRTGELKIRARYACSSAAGGLKMVAVGLVPDLTVAAAKLACMGAGAKLLGAYGYELKPKDVQSIVASKPDILLLCGGTDGGNTACIQYNARMLATVAPICPVVIAGNRMAVEHCREILSNWETVVTENVMPTLNVANAEPAGEEIRKIFLRRIVYAKGLSRMQSLLEGIVMPTPFAVMNAAKLLACGTEKTPGLGDLIGVDLGGATTDVYSMADGMPTMPNTTFSGMLEPYAKRTVEGDLGMRYGADGVLAAAGIERVAEQSGLEPQEVEAMVAQLQRCPEQLPQTPQEIALDTALAKSAVQIAVRRHAGRVERIFTPMGNVYSQRGKDLLGVRTVFLTGGALIHARHPYEIGMCACADAEDPQSLRPKDAEILLDRRYILPAMGLLAQHDEEAALLMMKRELIRV